LKGIEDFRVFIDRTVAALTDPRRRERAIIGMLTGYALLWTVYGLFAKAGQGVQTDPAEIVAWSRHLALGYIKHPPLAAWLVYGWFTIFPVAEWSFYLFSMVYTFAGLWLAWRLFGYYLDADKRVVALALLTLVPIYNFFALRFDVNIVLPPLWAATTLCFVRSFETRSAGWAALAGAAAAVAMLGKYWSLFLLIGLAVAVLLDPRRGIYFRSRAPWITLAFGAALLAPHIAWLVHSDFSPLGYAFDERATHSFAETLKATGKYLAGGAGYMAAPVLLALAASRPSLAACADIVYPQSRERRFVLIAFLTPPAASRRRGARHRNERQRDLDDDRLCSTAGRPAVVADDRHRAARHTSRGRDCNRVPCADDDRGAGNSDRHPPHRPQRKYDVRRDARATDAARMAQGIRPAAADRRRRSRYSVRHRLLFAGRARLAAVR